MIPDCTDSLKRRVCRDGWKAESSHFITSSQWQSTKSGSRVSAGWGRLHR